MLNYKQNQYDMTKCVFIVGMFEEKKIMYLVNVALVADQTAEVQRYTVVVLVGSAPPDRTPSGAVALSSSSFDVGSTFVDLAQVLDTSEIQHHLNYSVILEKHKLMDNRAHLCIKSTVI